MHRTPWMLLLAGCLLFVAFCCAGWYWVSVRYYRRRAREIVLWLQAVLAGHGQVLGIRWLAPSRFKVPLRLSCGLFQRACMLVEMAPIQMPVLWLLSKFHGEQELVTFQSDLDLPPAFSLHLQNFRWFARSRRRASRNRGAWVFEHSGPFVISTRADWKKEISSATASLTLCNHEFSSIDFQRRTPHFSVTLPLETISPESPSRACVFESMRELASSASASRF